MKFRTKIFLAIVLPSSALVAVAVVVSLARITREYEERAEDQLSRTKEAFEGTISEQFNQLVTLSKPFEGPRFDAAITRPAAAQPQNTPFRFTPMMVSMSSSVVSMTGELRMMPATFAHTSTRPVPFTAARARSSTCSFDDTSVGTTMTLAPSIFSIKARVSSSFVSSRSGRATPATSGSYTTTTPWCRGTTAGGPPVTRPTTTPAGSLNRGGSSCE